MAFPPTSRIFALVVRSRVRTLTLTLTLALARTLIRYCQVEHVLTRYCQVEHVFGSERDWIFGSEVTLTLTLTLTRRQALQTARQLLATHSHT